MIFLDRKKLDLVQSLCTLRSAMKRKKTNSQMMSLRVRRKLHFSTTGTASFKVGLFVLFCFALFCFVLFCFVLFCFVLFRFVLFCFVLFCSVCLFDFLWRVYSVFSF